LAPVPRGATLVVEPELVRKLLHLWRGELPLGEAFWTYAVIGGIAVNLTTTLLFFVLLTADLTITALIVHYAPSLPYNLLVAVGVWRSAGRHPGAPHWATLARAVTLVGMGILSLT
jgi:hypothetical protein